MNILDLATVSLDVNDYKTAEDLITAIKKHVDQGRFLLISDKDDILFGVGPVGEILGHSLVNQIQLWVNKKL